MATTGSKYPTAFVSGGQWSNPNNAYANNGQATREDQNGHSQQWSTFNFGLPTIDTIYGILITIEGLWEDSNSIQVALSWNGGSNWTALKTATNFGYSWTVDTVGGAADNWGRTWSQSDFDTANFRVRFTKQGQDYVWMDVDYFHVEVFYTEVSGWSGGNVNTVTNQGAVNGVSLGSISKVNGV